MRRIALVAVLLAPAGCDEVVGLKQRPDAAAPTDATPDAPTDALACPPGYESIVGLTSKYRIIALPGSGRLQHIACMVDGTHLMVPTSMEELALVHQALGSGPLLEDRAWIGVVQLAGATTPADGWIAVTDELPILEWAMTTEGEPNDGADNLENGEEQLAHLQRGAFRYLIDGNATMKVAAICECDGRAMTTAGLAAMAQLP